MSYSRFVKLTIQKLGFLQKTLIESFKWGFEEKIKPTILVGNKKQIPLFDKTNNSPSCYRDLLYYSDIFREKVSFQQVFNKTVEMLKKGSLISGFH